MTAKRVLIVDDDEITRNLLEEMLNAQGYVVALEINGKKALEQFKKNPFQVVVTDIEMPVMDGNELISRLVETEDDPVIVVLTVHDELDLVIDTMKKGVYDYIIKPFNADDILIKLRRAFEAADLRRMKRVLAKEKVVKLENQVNWFKWQDDFVKQEDDRIDRALFKSLHENFNQGSGFGLLMSLLDMISTSGKKEGDNYLIKAELYEMILRSKKYAEGVLTRFSEINNIISSEFELLRISLVYVHTLIEKVIQKVSKYKDVKNHNILFSKKKAAYSDVYVKINEKYFGDALYELLINALKFSEAKTDIIMMLHFDDKNSEISIINNPAESDKGTVGVPIEYENMVFDPFFRLVNYVHEEYETPDYGLGLTLVEKIIERHGGVITASNIKDYSDFSRDPIVKVSFTFTIPLDNENL